MSSEGAHRRRNNCRDLLQRLRRAQEETVHKVAQVTNAKDRDIAALECEAATVIEALQNALMTAETERNDARAEVAELRAQERAWPENTEREAILLSHIRTVEAQLLALREAAKK